MLAHLKTLPAGHWLSVVTGARLVWADDLVALTSTSDPKLPWEEQLSHLLGNSNLFC